MRVIPVLLAVLMATAADAQEEAARPAHTGPAATQAEWEHLESLRLCRAAAIVEVSGGARSGADAVYPQIADTLLDQIAYAAADRIFHERPSTVAQSRQRMERAESLIMGFAQVVSKNREQLAKPAERRAILLGCIAPAWQGARNRIDRRSGAAPAGPPPGRDAGINR